MGWQGRGGQRGTAGPRESRGWIQALLPSRPTCSCCQEAQTRVGNCHPGGPELIQRCRYAGNVDDGEVALGDVLVASSHPSTGIRAGAVLGPVPSSGTASPAETPARTGGRPGHSLAVQLGFVSQRRRAPRGSHPPCQRCLRLPVTSPSLRQHKPFVSAPLF